MPSASSAIGPGPPPQEGNGFEAGETVAAPSSSRGREESSDGNSSIPLKTLKLRAGSKSRTSTLPIDSQESLSNGAGPPPPSNGVPPAASDSPPLSANGSSPQGSPPISDSSSSSADEPRGRDRTTDKSSTTHRRRSQSAARSTHNTIFPAGDARNQDAETLTSIRSAMMVNFLYEQQQRQRYATPAHPWEGVVLKISRGRFTCCPPQMTSIPDSLFDMVVRMNVRCAMTVNTPAVSTLLETLCANPEYRDYVPLEGGLRVQILRTMGDLPRCQLHHFAAFIEEGRMLVVWDDEPGRLMGRAEELERRFIAMLWGKDGGEEGEEGGEGEKEEGEVTKDLEEAVVKEHRPLMLQSALMVSATMALSIACLGLGWRALAMEISVDGSMLRLVLLLASVPQWFLSLFFFQTIVGNLFQILGPTSAIGQNSRYYSGKRPRKRLDRADGDLPHVTIQMPVYKEGLSAVIKPTVLSLKEAISTYEMQGGQANIFVNDDGLQLLSEEEAMARRDFYEEHNIGWVARPAHDPKGEGKGGVPFLRRGKFKKASNMNYALHVSTRVEEKLALVERPKGWGHEDEHGAYRMALAEVLKEDEGRSWAEGNIRVGDYILLIDSDTRVPADCLLDAVSEMDQSPEVAIIQFSSGVVNVTGSYFENGVTWFTNLIYTAITFAVSNGDACPFVGHNAILRWQAVQDAAAYTDADQYEKYWSESHVSEDFDMALRLQVAGYSLRFAAYTGTGFQEGVSLTVYDELARWEKYAYGCSELLFHPLRFWPVRGPLTPLFRAFVAARAIPLAKKLTICAYIGTYYAIAAAWGLCLANYFVTGWFSGLFDKYYIDSFAIYISIVVVFNGLGNVALAVLRYRAGDRGLAGALWENVKWVPMFTLFLGGISLHVSQAILCHMFEVDMAWGATAKELEAVHFGEEAARILRRFRGSFAYCLGCMGLMVAGAWAFPVAWRIDLFYSVYPLAVIVASHLLLPVLLNPALMMFTW